ncbi:TPA: glycosyltransferase family 52 [Streptococcus suis]
MKKIKNQSLIICSTPYQIFLIEQIVRENIDEQFILLYNGMENEKSRFYFDNLSKKCVASYFFNCSSFFDYLITYKKFTKLNHFNFSKIYCASLHKLEVQYLVNYFIESDVITYDDGLANILYNSSLFFDTDEYKGLNAVKIRIKSLLFGTNLSMRSIKNRAIKHFSVYNHKENIIKNVSLIEFPNNYVKNSPQYVKAILLGQPFISETNGIFLKIQSKFDNLPAYFPHPRETNIPENFEIIKSNYLVEDYLLQNSDTFFYVYTFVSTAAVNIKDFPNVIVKALYSEMIPDEFVEVYNLFKDFDIEVINIDE